MGNYFAPPYLLTTTLDCSEKLNSLLNLFPGNSIGKLPNRLQS